MPLAGNAAHAGLELRPLGRNEDGDAQFHLICLDGKPVHDKLGPVAFSAHEAEQEVRHYL